MPTTRHVERRGARGKQEGSAPTGRARRQGRESRCKNWFLLLPRDLRPSSTEPPIQEYVLKNH